MSETHTVHNINDFNIPSFKAFWNNSTYNKFDGSMIYIKEEIYQNSHVVEVQGTKCVKGSLAKNGAAIDILGFYRSPSTNIDDFIINLDTILREHTSADPNQISVIAGDLNINILDTTTPSVNNYLTVLNSYGFHSKINKATRVQGNSATCIDHFFIKSNNDIYDNTSGVILTTHLTDHYPILLNIKLKLVETIPKKQSIKKLDHQALSQLLSNAGWDDVLGCNDVNISTNNFITKLKYYIEKCTNTRKLNNKRKCLKPWITGGLLRSIRKRDALKKQCTLSPNNLASLNNYKKYRNSLSKLIKKSRYDYYKDKLGQCLNDSKKTWSVIREATGDRENRHEINYITDRNNVKLTEPKLIANEFNSYFSTIGGVLAGGITPPPPAVRGIGVHNTANPNTFYLAPTTENELINEINSLKSGVSSGEDGVTSEVLKYNHQHLLQPLKHIINCIFYSGVYPDALKTAIIVPIHKQGERGLTSNYRPIALISSISKLFEKCIKHKVMLFLEKYNLLSSNQFAFREDLGTEGALCKVTETILQGLDAGDRVVGIFLDLKKAFDTVDHRILLERLQNMGIRGTTNNLFKSYLTGRTQKVKIIDAVSDTLQVECGVPQGTVLGPLLFNIYMNDVLSVCGGGRVFCFADDTAVIINGKSWNSVMKKAEKAITELKTWLDASLLSLNTDKTKFMTFGLTRSTLPQLQYLRIHRPDCTMDANACNCSTKIEREPFLKYLGILIDETLTWKNHIEYTTTKIRKLIYKFYQLRHILPLKTLRMVYFSLVESIICYGIVIWGNAGGTIMSALYVAQKYIIKIMLFKNKRFPTQELFQESSLLTLEQLYIKSIIRFMMNYSYYKNNLNHQINTRTAARHDVLLPSVRCTVAQKHIGYVGPKIYNILPPQFRASRYKQIKSKVNSWIIENNITAELYKNR